MSPLLRRGGGAEEAVARRTRTLPTPPLMAEALRDGAVTLTGAAPDTAARLRVAVLVAARAPSAEQAALTALAGSLRERGHAVTLGADPSEPCDVLLSTGWQTVPLALRTPHAAARALLLFDHEPDRYPVSIEREWATWAYGQDLHAICASPWLAQMMRSTYGAPASTFDPGIDTAEFRALAIHRRDDLVLAFARPGTPHHASALAVLALEELHARRPQLEIALFGDARPLQTTLPHVALGALPPSDAAQVYNSAAAGLICELTSPSTRAVEMLACALAVVGLDTAAMRESFGAEGPITLAAPSPGAIADAIELLLDDMVLRAQRTRAGLELAEQRTWSRAAEQVEAGLRDALRRAASG